MVVIFALLAFVAALLGIIFVCWLAAFAFMILVEFPMQVAAAALLAILAVMLL